MPTSQFNVVFDLDSSSATFGKWILTSTTLWSTPYDEDDVIGYWDVTGPDYDRVGSFGSPDVEEDTTRIFNTLEIPTATNGGLLVGTYTFTLHERWDNGVDPAEDFVSAVTTFYFNPTSGVFDDCTGLVKKACGNLTIDCFAQTLVWKDITNVGSPTTDDPSVFLNYSTPDGFVEPSPVSSTQLTYQFTWVNVAYTFYIDRLLTYVDEINTPNVTVTIRITLSYGYILKCDQNLCNLITCWIQYNAKYKAQVNSLGGANLMPEVLTQDYNFIIGQITLFLSAQRCSGTLSQDETQKLYTDIANFFALNGCSCRCVDSNTPTQITPYNPVIPGGYTFDAVYPLVVDVDGDNNVTYSLDEAWLALVTALISSGPAITSSDSSVTITGTTTKNLTVHNRLDFVVTVTPTIVSHDLTVTITNYSRQGTRYVASLASTKAQVIGYPHSTDALLKAEYCVFYVKDFLTSPPGGEIPDKITVGELQILNAGASTTDFSQPKLFALEVFGRTTIGFYMRLVSMATGLPISVDSFLASISSFKSSISIKQ